jgi:hypothetical protein
LDSGPSTIGSSKKSSFRYGQAPILTTQKLTFKKLISGVVPGRVFTSLKDEIVPAGQIRTIEWSQICQAAQFACLILVDGQL